jgi:hypothetical protein
MGDDDSALVEIREDLSASNGVARSGCALAASLGGGAATSLAAALTSPSCPERRGGDGAFSSLERGGSALVANM